jgi:hypothetical protein
MMVSHGNEIDMIRPHAVNYVERKTLNDSLAEFATEQRACLGVSNDPFRCLLYGRQEPETEPLKPRFRNLLIRASPPGLPGGKSPPSRSLIPKLRENFLSRYTLHHTVA